MEVAVGEGDLELDAGEEVGFRMEDEAVGAGVELGGEVADAPEDEQIEALATHPRIGQRVNVSDQAAREQGSDEDPALLAALVKLNKSYEQKFGFRFVVFVDGRPRGEILSVLRQRLQNPRGEELAAGLDDLVAIALDRWRKR